MTTVDRYALVVALTDHLRASGSWCGQTHVQKASYLAQEMLGVPLGQDFRLYKYGPYSFGMSDDLAVMQTLGFLCASPRGPYGVSLEKTRHGERLVLERQEIVRRFRPHLKFIADEFGRKGVAELERLSTAFLVTREIDTASVDERSRRLMEYKPHVGRDAAVEAVVAIDDMIQRGKALEDATNQP